MLLYPNAKINIGLYVTEKRSDGFHNLESVFYPVELCDILEITILEGSKGECYFQSSGIILDCPDEKNLVVKAYRMLNERFDLPSVAVHLHKQIPFGAGLGGGSSDAAFMLKGLNQLFDLRLSDYELEQYAAHLGSDCAFFIKDRPAYAHGKGEELELVALNLQGWRLALVKPNCNVSTAEAYGGIVPKPSDFNLHRLPTLPVNEWREKISNDFEKTICSIYPQIEQIKQQLYGQGAVYASMSGSGATVYALFPEHSNPNFSALFPDCFVWSEVLS